MTDRDSDADRLQDRLSKRFDSDDGDKSAKQAKETKQTKQTKETKQATDSGGGSSDEGADDETAGESQPVDYRDEWETRLLYLPGDLSELLEYQYKRLDLETDWEIKKERHFYPAVVAHGVEDIAEMDADEFTAAVENLGIGPV